MKRKYPSWKFSRSILNAPIQSKMTEKELEEQDTIVETEMSRITHIEDRVIGICGNDILENKRERSGICYY